MLLANLMVQDPGDVKKQSYSGRSAHSMPEIFDKTSADIEETKHAIQMK